MRFAVTGGTGFIGRNFIKEVLEREYDISVLISNESQLKKIRSFGNKIEIIEVSLEDLNMLKNKLKDFDVVAHFAASASTKEGFVRTDIDLKKGVLLTYNVLEAMRINRIKKLIFPSAPAIYGYPIKVPTSEEIGMLLPVSLYGAAKLACEGLISGFCHLFEMKSWIFRLGNVVGPDMEKGVIRDFVNKLKIDDTRLEILGNGNQKKDVIYIEDCIKGMLFLFETTDKLVNVFNLSSGTTITVNRIAEIIQEEMKLVSIKKNYLTNNNIGWKGDVPEINYDISKIIFHGFKPRYNSEEAVRLTVRGMIK
jgi:UDP-glucose 4-epimerase